MNIQQRARQQRVSQHRVNPRQLASLFLALTLALSAAPPRAQTEGKDTPEAAPAASDGSADKPAATPAPPANGAAAQKRAGAGNSSPFDYRPSEEISEDVPVSFPVDI